jgi:hypothetical protein
MMNLLRENCGGWQKGIQDQGEDQNDDDFDLCGDIGTAENGCSRQYSANPDQYKQEN